jgi:ABC-type xylose transport system permease subunit
MVWTILVILFALWLLGFSIGHFGGVIHLLLVAFLIVLVFQFITGRRNL